MIHFESFIKTMDTINIDYFKKLDIRIGTIVKAEIPEWSHWVMKLEVDFGEEIGHRIIFSGIMLFYKPEDLEGKQLPFVINLEKKKIGLEGDHSEGMMLMAVASKKEMGQDPVKVGEEEVDEYPILFDLPEKVSNGTRVM